ncbi:hypothetical protein CLV59_11444 [Chitinophaga dinghuensis]|uniref:Uncharacterized protein n=1 Tax=Chitinophaga dinghuensis TaxID=1539050 RepID=A0A327VKE3_9BACT|nr:hypothetical protein CLV59_11444 [Chitinophaga dinghuensis]
MNVLRIAYKATRMKRGCIMIWTAPQKLDKKIKYFGTELGILPGSFHLDLV